MRTLRGIKQAGRLTAAVSLVLFLVLPGCGRKAPALRLHFIDVGYGDAILIESPGGGFSLVDTGYPEVREKLFGYLDERGAEKLEYLIVTHPHPDHLGSAAAAAGEFNPAYLRDNRQEIDRFDEYLTREMTGEYERKFRGRENYAALRAGDVISWDGLDLEVLWPRDLETSADWNTNSLVLLLRYGEFRALLTGDLNIPGERALLAGEGSEIKADLLKLGHHGAGDASSPEFLRAVSPRAAVVSVGENPWGYPDEELLARLEASGVRLHRTDRDGTVVIRASPDGSFRRVSR